ncbi:activator-dependent family glycosyltransferase [Spirillospora sp. NPDC050679]
MKVLFACWGHYPPTHYHTMVPLAWALRTAGHEARVAGPEELVEAVTEAGLTAVPAGMARWFMGNDPWAPELLQPILMDGTRHSQFFDYTGADREQWSWEGLLALEHVMGSALYASMNNDQLIDDLVGYARYWRPDLIISEPYTFAAAIAARVTGAAHARITLAPDIALRARREFLRLKAQRPPEQREDPTAEWLGQCLERYGHTFDEEIIEGHWTIDPLPESLRLDLGLRVVPTRYVPFHGPSVVPEWLGRPAERRRICLTLGQGGSHVEVGDSLGELLAAMGDLDAEVIVTLDAEQLAGLPGLPGNIRPVGFVPLSELMPTCSAVVHAGGNNTRATAQLYGVPQCFLYSGWDSAVAAARIEELGAGLTVPIARIDAAEVRDKLRRLLDEPSFAKAAMELRAQMLAQPTTNETVATLERLTARHRAARADRLPEAGPARAGARTAAGLAGAPSP